MFSGSGTTLDLAEQLGRKWIGIDNSSEAIRNIFKRFYTGLAKMGDFVNNADSKHTPDNNQQTLFEPQIKYNSNLTERRNFNFFSDKRFKHEILEIIDEHII